MSSASRSKGSSSAKQRNQLSMQQQLAAIVPETSSTSASEDMYLKLNKLDEVQRKVGLILRTVGLTLEELAKDRPEPKQVERLTRDFLDSVRFVESELNQQIQYLNQLSTGLAYHGTPYVALWDRDLTREIYDCVLDTLKASNSVDNGDHTIDEKDTMETTKATTELVKSDYLDLSGVPQ